MAFPARSLRYEKVWSVLKLNDSPSRGRSSVGAPNSPAEVELELLALENVTVGAARLSRSGRDGSVETTGLELGLEEGVDLGLLLALGEDALDVSGLGLLGGLSGGLLGLLICKTESAHRLTRRTSIGSPVREKAKTHADTLLGNGLGVVGLVPLTEGGSVDLDDARLDNGVGANELVVRGVVDDTNDAGLASGVLGSPGKVARLEAKGAVLEVSTTSANGVDTLSSKLGHGGLTTKLELSLLAVVGTLSSL